MIKSRIKQMIQDMQISSTDTIPLVNKAWDVSFARVEKNKKAIYERGWFPFNRNLLLHPDIRTSMTDEDIKNEKRLYCENDDEVDEETNEQQTPTTNSPTNTNNTINLEHPQLSSNSSISTLTTTSSTRTDEPISAFSELHKIVLEPDAINFNYQSPPAALFLQTLVRENDLTKAREDIKLNKDKGLTVKEKIKSIKGKVTAVKLVKCSTHSLSKDLFDRVKEQEVIKLEKEKVKKIEDDNKYLLLVNKSKSVRK